MASCRDAARSAAPCAAARNRGRHLGVPPPAAAHPKAVRRDRRLDRGGVAMGDLDLEGSGGQRQRLGTGVRPLCGPQSASRGLAGAWVRAIDQRFPPLVDHGRVTRRFMYWACWCAAPRPGTLRTTVPRAVGGGGRPRTSRTAAVHEGAPHRWRSRYSASGSTSVATTTRFTP
jgi:hypothetical protein